jgi:hypothetical protein
MLIAANSHKERAGRPTNSNRKNARMPLRMTCQPIVIYFSWDRLRSRFHNACKQADVKRRRMAGIDIVVQTYGNKFECLDSFAREI